MHPFSRRQYAKELADMLLGKSIFSDAPNGVFLAAPRRTGKSTFLRLDLKPELERQGAVVIYVDLWADPTRDPGSLIAEAVAGSLREHGGAIPKTVKASGLESISLGGFKIDLGKIGRMDGATLADAFRALHKAAKAPIALIVDEAQHSLTSEWGENTMFALKSARDQLNEPGVSRFMLVMSGSDRDKLARLVSTSGAPFFGSHVQHMPELGLDFMGHIAGHIEAKRPELKPVNQGVLFGAFKQFGNRPQPFIRALESALSPLTDFKGRFEKAVLQAAAQNTLEGEAQMESDFLSLQPLERAVLWRLLEQGRKFRPYDAEALRFYKEKTGSPVTAKHAQVALDALRGRTPALAWKSARSEYAANDTAMHEWFQRRVQAKTWPPKEKNDLLAMPPSLFSESGPAFHP